MGESGSGKTTLVRSVIGLLDRNVRVVSGSIAVHEATIIEGRVDRTREVSRQARSA